MEEQVRSVPYNNDAEMYVLGSVLLENNVMNQLLGKLFPEDFFNAQNRTIYQAMLTLFNSGQTIETVSVVEQLVRDNVSNVEDYKRYLIELIDLIPSTSSVNLYIEIVEEKSVQRKLLNNISEISQDILASRHDFNTILDKTEDIVLNVIKKRRTSEFVSLAEASKKVYEIIEGYVGNKQDLIGLNTGFPFLNQATLGFQKGDLMILAARPAVGKSAYAINLALNVANLNDSKHVAFFSLEMSIEQLMMRIFSYKASLEMGDLRKGNLKSEDLLMLSLAREELSKLNLHFDENASSNIADIRAKCRQLKNAGKLDFVVIDYLQLITVANSKGNRQEEVSKISRQLKQLALELQVPILALSQLSRGVEGREDKRPSLADLRESGSIEQDADLVMFLYRRSDVEGEEELPEGVQKEKKAYIDVVLEIGKNRQGERGHADYHFYGGHSKFSEQKETRPVVPKKKTRQIRTKQLND